MKRLLVALLAVAAITTAQEPPKALEGPSVVTDAYGNRIGTVTPTREIKDAYGNLVGKIRPDGTVIDKYGNRVGRVAPAK